MLREWVGKGQYAEDTVPESFGRYVDWIRCPCAALQGLSSLLSLFFSGQEAAACKLNILRALSQ